VVNHFKILSFTQKKTLKTTPERIEHAHATGWIPLSLSLACEI